MSYGTFTNNGRAAMISALVQGELFFAWGSGDESWDDDESLRPTLLTASALTNEVGRRRIQVKYCVTPDDDGDISMPTSFASDGSPITQNYSISEEATQILYVRVTFDYADASDETIREVAIFSETVVSEDAPAGQLYFEPDEVVGTGIIIAARHLTAVKRDPTRKDTHEFILSI